MKGWTKRDQAALQLAVYLAIQWERSLLDTLRGAEGREDRYDVQQCRENLARFERLRDKLTRLRITLNDTVGPVRR